MRTHVVINEMELEEQLERISSSGEFRKCPQLLRFLRFAAQEAISGREGGSKERLIGIEVFGRAPDYDAGADPVVRVEARRLRRKLAEYYAGVGRADPLEIRLPKGGYLAEIEPRAVKQSHAIAILPFSGPDLCAGLTTRLIARLTACGRMKVFREESSADLILRGSVRQAGERFRCDSQLVSAADGLHLWAGSFDCVQADAFAVEDEFADRIARAVCGASLQ